MGPNANNRSFLPFGSLASALAASALVGIFGHGCVNKKNREKGELRSITVLSKNTSAVDLLLLKSMGFSPDIRFISMKSAVQLQGGASEGLGVHISGLQVSVRGGAEDSFRKVAPLYSHAASTAVRFAAVQSQLQLSDFLSPAAQALVGRELKLNDSSLRMSSADALLSLLMADAAQLKFNVHDPGNLTNLFLDGLSFKSVGEIPASSKIANADKRERNSGLSIGDVLIITDPDLASGIRHAALWLDHDVYFEAVPVGDSIVFRIGTYAQLIEELARRVSVDVRQLRMKFVRRGVVWSDIGTRIRQFKEQKNAGSCAIVQDPAGRGVASALQGLTLTQLSVSESSR